MHETPTGGYGHLGVVSSVQAAPGPPPSLTGMQAPIQDPGTALAAGAAGGPGGRTEAFEGVRADSSRWEPAPKSIYLAPATGAGTAPGDLRRSAGPPPPQFPP